MLFNCMQQKAFVIEADKNNIEELRAIFYHRQHFFLIKSGKGDSF